MYSLNGLDFGRKTNCDHRKKFSSELRCTVGIFLRKLTAREQRFDDSEMEFIPILLHIEDHELSKQELVLR